MLNGRSKNCLESLPSPTGTQAISFWLRTLTSAEYLAKRGTNGGFILKHSVGNLPKGTEVDVPLTYADYYYVEALVRYKKMVSGTLKTK